MSTIAAKIRTPEPLRVEHEALHLALADATRAPGRTGEAAREVARVLHPHFLREDELALPPLGLLEDLASGRVTPEMAEVLALTEVLARELPRMLEEHGAIRAALEKLEAAARAEDRPEEARLARQIMLHAQAEEQVTYPAAILAGEYLKIRLGAMA